MMEYDLLLSVKNSATKSFNLIVDTKNPLHPYRLIGYFADDDDVGYIFLDHNNDKHYIPAYRQFYISDLNNITEVGILLTLNEITGKEEEKFVVKNNNGCFFWLRGCSSEKEINRATGVDIPLICSVLFEDFRINKNDRSDYDMSNYYP